MNKNESKYFNTAIKMDEALIALLEKKSFEYISIKEICDKAGVNRSTFYLHYENTLDLLKEATKHILDSFLTYFTVNTKSIAYRFDACELNELVFITPEYITPYLTFVKDNQRLFKTTLKSLAPWEWMRCTIKCLPIYSARSSQDFISPRKKKLTQ